MSLKTIPKAGQRNMVPPARIEKVFTDIFKNRYYTNHGPFGRELEGAVQELLGVRHAIAMVNESLAMIIAAMALGVSGRVICSHLAPPAVYNAMKWVGLEPLACPTHNGIPDETALESMIDDSVCAICVSRLHPRLASPEGLERLANKHAIKVFFESFAEFGASVHDKMVGGFGTFEVFSLHEKELVNAGEGGIVCTNDDSFAARVRNIRSSYGAGKVVKVPITGNGRMSEAQAAMALASMEEMVGNIVRNKQQYLSYREQLAGIAGLVIVPSDEGTRSTHTAVALSVSRENCLAELRSGIAHLRLIPAPGQGIYSALQVNGAEDVDYYMLPTGQHVSDDDIEIWCQEIRLTAQQGKSGSPYSGF